MRCLYFKIYKFVSQCILQINKWWHQQHLLFFGVFSVYCCILLHTQFFNMLHAIGNVVMWGVPISQTI